MEVDSSSWQSKLVTRIGKGIRSNKAYTEESIRKNEQKGADTRRKRLQKRGQTRTLADASSNQEDVNELGERNYSVVSQASTLINNRDYTDVIHGLAHHDSFDSLVDKALAKEKLNFEPEDPKAREIFEQLMALHAQQFAALSSEVWRQIASLLDPADAASLAVSSRTLYQKIGHEPLRALNRAENRRYRYVFLNYLDRSLPQHLLCFPCSRFHSRSNPGQESLKADYVNNPLFYCPKARDTVLPRTRLTHGRELPYAFVQLALRGQNFTTGHGIQPESLSRRWKDRDSGWTHRTRYMINDGHLLGRVVSQAVTLPGKEMTETRMRHLLYDREEYTPFFSVCAHWRDGDLMRVCKCAILHVPEPPQTYSQQLKKGPQISRTAAHPSFIVRGCGICRPMRRCPECPSEYLVEIQMVEDKEDPFRRFKHAITVTRWFDLGDGTSPHSSPEWVAINGTNAENSIEPYESYESLGRRALSGVFESKVSGSVPGQYMKSLNPRNEKLGEEGHGWY